MTTMNFDVAKWPPIEPGKTRIGFIGTGIMGSSMAGHLQKAGYTLYVYNRTKAKASKLLEKGANWCNSVAEVARQSDVLFTIVSLPADVRRIYYLDTGGILASAKPYSVLCDMTTSEPSLARQIFESARTRNIVSLDAPVTGGDIGAREARLSILVGGVQEGFNHILPLLKLMGKNIVFMGPAGCGQHAKMCNQIAIAGTMLGMLEALRYAKNAGIDQKTLLAGLQEGAASSWSLMNLAPRIVDNNFGPGFKIDHFVKDMTIAQEEAKAMELNMPCLDKALELYRQAQKAGGGELGTHGLYQLWEKHPEW